MSLKSKMTALADAVREKAGVTGLLSIDGMTEAVKGIQTGGSGASAGTGHVDNKKIWFIDYDGTIVDSWEVSELEGKTELPEAPVHEALTAQGWNWTLAELKSFGRPALVGQCYIPSDGKTKIYISLSEKLDIEFLLNFSSGITCTIDWGDGNQTVLESSMADKIHSYAAVGDYVIMISSDSGSYTLGDFSYYDTVNTQRGEGNSFVRKVFLASNASLKHAGFSDCARLEAVTISATSALESGSFSDCKSLRTLVLPAGTTIPNSFCSGCSGLECISIGPGVKEVLGSAFYYCYGLKFLTLTDQLKAINSFAFGKCENLERIDLLSDSLEVYDSTNYMFIGCLSLEEVVLPEGITEVGSSMFSSCTNLQKIVLPSTITSISSNTAFSNCNAMYHLYVKAVTPPTGVSGMFSSFMKDCKIYVPADSLEAYQAAEYWADYADKMEEIDFSAAEI